jgi:hypothetical protein
VTKLHIEFYDEPFFKKMADEVIEKLLKELPND